MRPSAQGCRAVSFSEVDDVLCSSAPYFEPSVDAGYRDALLHSGREPAFRSRATPVLVLFNSILAAFFLS